MVERGFSERATARAGGAIEGVGGDRCGWAQEGWRPFGGRTVLWMQDR